MDVQNPNRASGNAPTLEDVRRWGNPQGFEVLVDLGAVVLGGDLTWCKIKRLRKPGARFALEVWVGEHGVPGTFRADEVQAVRRGA